MWGKLTFPFFSSRVFAKRPLLYQINTSWKQSAQWSELDFAIYGPLHSLGKKMAFFDKTQGRGLTHLEFLIPTFIEKIPAIIAQAQALKSDFTFYLS